MGNSWQGKCLSDGQQLARRDAYLMGISSLSVRPSPCCRSNQRPQPNRHCWPDGRCVISRASRCQLGDEPAESCPTVTCVKSPSSWSSTVKLSPLPLQTNQCGVLHTRRQNCLETFDLNCMYLRQAQQPTRKLVVMIVNASRQTDMRTHGQTDRQANAGRQIYRRTGRHANKLANRYMHGATQRSSPVKVMRPSSQLMFPARSLHTMHDQVHIGACASTSHITGLHSKLVLHACWPLAPVDVSADGPAQSSPGIVTATM